jgi:transposase
MSTEVTFERVDELPILLHGLQQLKLAETIDAALGAPHGDRRGLSYGQLSVLLVAFIMSQAEHRLCAVEDWVKTHHLSLSQITGWEIGEKDATDDRLGGLVERLGRHEEARFHMEQQLGGQMIRGYGLPTEVGRCDSSSFSVYHQIAPEEEEERLLRFGHSKDHRPDLRQYRQVLGTLDPAGVPLLSATLPGHGADDPIYVPMWERMAQTVGHKDFVFIADCKASAHSTRAQIDQQGGLYCVPLALTGRMEQTFTQWVLDPPAAIEAIYLPGQDLSEEPIGEGFELQLGQRWRDDQAEEATHNWMERQLVVRSHALAQQQQQGLEQRLGRAEAALNALSKRSHKDCCALEQEVKALLKRHRVSEFFQWQVQYAPLMRYTKRGRPKPGDLSQQRLEERCSLSFERNAGAIAQAQRSCGWRIYVTNAPITRLERAQAVAYYRDQWTLERGYSRFKRGALPALPIFLQSDERIIGLMFLLTVALRLFTLMEFVVRRQLEQDKTEVAGLYAGNPKRTTRRPSTESLLGAFAGITLCRLPSGDYYITPLTPLQTQILTLMGIPPNLYHRLKLPSPSLTAA